MSSSATSTDVRPIRRRSPSTASASRSRRPIVLERPRRLVEPPEDWLQRVKLLPPPRPSKDKGPRSWSTGAPVPLPGRGAHRVSRVDLDVALARADGLAVGARAPAQLLARPGLRVEPEGGWRRCLTGSSSSASAASGASSCRRSSGTSRSGRSRDRSSSSSTVTPTSPGTGRGSSSPMTPWARTRPRPWPRCSAGVGSAVQAIAEYVSADNVGLVVREGDVCPPRGRQPPDAGARRPAHRRLCRT